MSRITTFPPPEGCEEVLSRDALDFLGELQSRFGPRRKELLTARCKREAPTAFDPETAGIREDESWRVVAPAPDYADRRVEITGPTDRKLVINALNSGARGFMADFEDANSPTWVNQVEGQRNIREAIEGTIQYESPDGRRYELRDDPATLLVRPRGLHLDEAHARIADEPIAGALFDYGLFTFHCARPLIEGGSRPYLYLPKLEHRLEARWWSEVIAFSEEALGLKPSSVRATVLIETLPAAFQMDEILFELREHSAGLNAGRWDYIFSMIKCHRDRPDFILPDRSDVTMGVPFMRAYTGATRENLSRTWSLRDGRNGSADPEPQRPRDEARAIEGVRATRDARPARVSTAPGLPIPTWSRWRPRCSAPSWAGHQTRSTGSMTTQRSAVPSCST